MKSEQKGIISVIIIGLVLFVVIGAVSYVVVFNNDGSTETVNTNTSVANPVANSDSTALNYPALYQQYNLPEYPGATLTSNGRTSDNLADGIALKLTTQDDVQKVGEFYANAFTSLSGWVYTPPKFSSGSLYTATAEKADQNLRYQLTVSNTSSYSQISITFLEI